MLVTRCHNCRAGVVVNTPTTTPADRAAASPRQWAADGSATAMAQEQRDTRSAARTADDQHEFRDDNTCVLKQVQGKRSFTGAPCFAETEHERCAMGAALTRTLAAREPVLDELAALVSRLFEAPIGIVALVDIEHTHIRGGTGMEQAQPTDRRWSICTWMLVPMKPEVLVVEDLSKDARFASHPLVCEPPFICFYAGAPLVMSSGHRLGTLCAVDYVSRRCEAANAKLLCNLAELVVQEIEARAPPSSAVCVHRTERKGAAKARVLLLDTHTNDWQVVYKSQGWPSQALASSCSSSADADGSCSSFWEAYTPYGSTMGEASAGQQYRSLTAKSHSFQLVVRERCADRQILILDMRPADTASLWDEAVPVSVSIAHTTNGAAPRTAGLYFAVLLNENCVSGRSGSAGTSGGSSADVGAIEVASSSTPFADVALGGLLGQGSYGRVFHGLMAGQAVAVKVVPHLGPQTLTAAHRERIMSGLEATVGMRLEHPHVVHAHKYAICDLNPSGAGGAGGGSSSDGTRGAKRPKLNALAARAGVSVGGADKAQQTWIVQEYCNRGTVQDAIDTGALRSSHSAFEGGPDVAAVLDVARQVARGCAALHAAGVVHGDLTPKNVLLCDPPPGAEAVGPSGVVAKVSDFGLARELSFMAPTCMTGTCGTPTHMPPELLQAGRMGPPADVYAFGVMLWELFTGQRPFAGYSAVQVVARRLVGSESLSFPPGTPPTYKQLAERCMDPDPEQRPGFEDLAQRLDALLAEQTTGQLPAAPAFPVWPDPWPAMTAVREAAAAAGDMGVAPLGSSGAAAGSNSEQGQADGAPAAQPPC